MKVDRRVLAAGLALLATPLPAAPQDAVGTRSAGYRALGAAFKSVNDQLRSGAPEKAALQKSAGAIQAAAKAQYGWFPQGSGPAPGIKTSAKPEIWSQGAKFKAAQDNFAAQANAFAKVVAGGDVAAIRVQTKQLGASCKACHDSFRSDAKS